jgi:hypothetical protein
MLLRVARAQHARAVREEMQIFSLWALVWAVCAKSTLLFVGLVIRQRATPRVSETFACGSRVLLNKFQFKKMDVILKIKLQSDGTTKTMKFGLTEQVSEIMDQIAKYSLVPVALWFLCIPRAAPPSAARPGTVSLSCAESPQSIQASTASTTLPESAGSRRRKSFASTT